MPHALEVTLETFINILSGGNLAEATPLTSIEIDSREVKAGSLFVAMPGESSDGHDYVPAALNNGAAAALIDKDVEADAPLIDLRAGHVGARHASPVLLRVDNTVLALQEVARQWVRRFPDLRIIGITGSVGKTTTKELVAEVLSQQFNTLKSEKSYNNEIGIPLSVLRLNSKHERAVLEMSMYVPGEIALLCDIAPPQVGVYTIIAPVHLERAGSMQAIIDAKAELVESLPADGVAILNMDDARVMTMADRTQARAITYGETSDADLWADHIEGLGLDGVRFDLHHQGETFHVHLPILGRHSVHTALRAAAVGMVEGMNWAEIISGLQNTESQLRLLAVKGPNGSIILDDTYNASPPSMLAALNLLNDLTDGQRIAVLGDMLELGAEEISGHRQVGIRAAAVATLLVTVGKRGQMIAEAAYSAHMNPDDILAVDTAEEAAAYVADHVKPGDTVLVKGSRAVGMERVVKLLTEGMG